MKLSMIVVGLLITAGFLALAPAATAAELVTGGECGGKLVYECTYCTNWEHWTSGNASGWRCTEEHHCTIWYEGSCRVA